MNGDIVLVRIDERSNGSRAEGKIIRIVERKVTEIVGEYKEFPSYALLC